MSAQEKAFAVTAGPGTDLWRKPPSTDRNNVPTKTLAKLPLKDFKRAGLTFSAQWTRLYDQGGIVFFLRRTHGHHGHYEEGGEETEKNKKKKDQWVKAGVELYQGTPFLGIVCTDNWSDWSLTPITTSSSSSTSTSTAANLGGEEVSIEADRGKDELGRSLWIYQIVRDAQGGEARRVPLRECNFFFADEEGVELTVAAYAARPADATGADDELVVNFEGAFVDRVGGY